jgi:hypothetical protein
MTCKQAQQRPQPNEAVVRRTQNNMMSFTVNVNQLSHVTTIMRDFKNMKMGLKTRMKIWLKRLDNNFLN